MYIYINNIFLGINQLLLHLFAFVLIETLIFYLFIVKNMKKTISNMFKKISCKTYFHLEEKNKTQNINLFTNELEYQDKVDEDVNKKSIFIQKYIDHTNRTVIIMIIVIVLCLLLLLTILHLVGSIYNIKVDYNVITTVVSLLISIPIQIYYINNYIILESDPKNMIIIYEQINKYLLE